MTIDPGVKAKLGLPDVSQVGVVVRDMDRAKAFFESTLAIGPFIEVDVKFTDKMYRGQPEDFEMRLAFASLGPIEFELIQPTRGRTIYDDHLATKGEGLHHLGFDVKDMDAKVEYLKSRGIKVLQSGRTPVGGFAYMDTTSIAGVIIEMIQRKGRRA